MKMPSSAAREVSTLLIEIQTPGEEWIEVGYMHSKLDINWFESLPTYWRSPSRAVLGQVFEEKAESWQPRARAAIPHWFSHLLPEGQLRNEAAAAAGINPAREFLLFERLGADDLPGALRATHIPFENDVTAPETIADAKANEEAKSPLKFSLAGVQLKFSVSNGNRGITVPVSGQSGDTILKMPDGRAGYGGVPEAEYAAMTLAKLAGIDVAPVSLVDANDVEGLGKWASTRSGQSLLVERFDRKSGGGRVHVEELAQVMNIPSAKYEAKYQRANFETIASLIAGLVGVDAVGEVIDRIVFNALIGNGDAHLKNWAIIYPDGRNPILSPAYDIVPTVLYLPSDDLGLNLNGSKDFTSVSPKSFERLGAASGFGHVEARERAASAVDRVLAYWSELKGILNRVQFNALDQRLSSLALVS